MLPSEGKPGHVRLGEGTFAVPPWDLRDDDRFATAAFDAPHGIQQKHQKTPERNELETPFSESIVSGGRPTAARTNRGGALAGPHGNFDPLMVQAEPGVVIKQIPGSDGSGLKS